MRPVLALLKFLQRRLLPGLGLLVILVAALMSGLRLALPLVDEDVRAWLERAAAARGIELAVQRLELDWEGLGPRLALREATLTGHGGETPLHLDGLSIGLDIPGSLLTGRLQIGTVQVEGVRLRVLRDRDGRWQLRGLADRDQGDEVSGTSEGWPAWMGMARRVQLVGSRLCLRDERSGLDLRIDDIEALYEQGLATQRLALRLNLPERLGGRLEVRVRADGGPAELVQPSGEVWLSTSGLRLEGWSDLVGILPQGEFDSPVALADLPRFESGELRGQAWLSLEHGAMVDARAQLELADWRISHIQALLAGEREVALQSRLDVHLRHAGEGWALDLTATPPRASDAPQRFALRRHGERLAMAAEHIDIDLVRPWLVVTPILPPELRQALIQHRPVGLVDDLRMHMLLGETATELRGQARFSRLGWLGRGYLPDVRGVAGQAWMDGSAALLHLDSPGLAADFHGKFREPMAFEQVRGDLAVFWADTPRVVIRKLRLVNRDLELGLAMQLDLPANQGPLIALDGHFQRALADRVPAYLPVHELSEEALAWLEHALPGSGGVVPEGTLALHGDLGHFPYYDDGSGLFELRFGFHGLKLDFAPGWRRAEGLHGELAFINNGFHGRIDGGSMNGVSLRSGTVGMPDFDHPRLDLQLALDGRVESMLEVLKSSPLIADRSDLDAIRLTGPAALRVQAEVRLDSEDPKPSGAEGWIDLHGARLAAHGQGFDRIQGQLHFVDDALDASDIRAQYKGVEARLAVMTEQVGPKFAYRIGLETQARPQDWLDPTSPWLRRLKGHFPLSAELLIPPASNDGRMVRLGLKSSLEGLAIDLPAPYGKPAETSRATTAELTWRAAVLGQLRLSQPGLLDARLKMDGERLLAGVIHLGEGEGAAPNGEPRILVEGKLPSFDLAAWQAMLDTPGGGGDQPLPPKVEVRARLGHLLALGGDWEDMGVEGQRDPTGWRLKLQSPRLAGLVRVPHAPTPAEPVSLDLARLILRDDPEDAPAEPDGPPADPTDIPPLRVNIAELQQGELRLKDVQARALPQPRGLLLQELRADTPHLALRGDGSWMLANGGQETRLNLTLESGNVGEALGELGFRKALRKGRLDDTQLRLRWPDAPDRFDWAILQGDAQFSVLDGSIENVEPGAGRVLGLLSIAELPRRLSLDFGDVFGEGLRFERINSKLNFKDGRMITEAMELAGPSARVIMKGHSDMLHKTLHYDMVVVPALGNVLPVIGTVAGGPLVGGAVFLVQKLFDKLSSDPVGFNYRVTGSWDEPKVERAEKLP